MAEAVTKQATGVCEKIEESGGWHAFHINVGSEYPVRIATKLEHLIKQAREVGPELATWTYKEAEATNADGSPRLNPKSGKPYVNRTLEKVEAGGLIPAETPKPGYIGADKDRSIVRQVALKATAQVFSGAANAGEDEAGILVRFLAFAAALETWAMRDLGDEEAPF